jgi:flagellar biosynthesis chaperone FliJ
MLTEIRSEQFREKAIKFGPSLNVVLGDDNATNSIGKSSLLMVIDFVFGGSSLLEYNKNIVHELGHHDYYFTFEFSGEVFKFRRGTFQPTVVYRCDENYGNSRPIELEKYTAFLKISYGIESDDVSFRGLVGLFSRVWGKENLDVHKPLHVVHNQRSRDCVDNLIRIFNLYASIRSLASELKENEQKRDALKQAFMSRIIPRIGKREYQNNEQRIDDIEREIGEIKNNLAQFATNIAEIANREVRELKVQKDELLTVRLNLETKLNRIQRNISENRYIKSRHFASIKQFFPDINVERLEQIDHFHSGLAKALRQEFENAEKDLQEQISAIDQELDDINSQMAATLSTLDNPTHIIDRVYELTERLNTAKEENNYYDSNEEIKTSVVGLNNQLSEEKSRVIKFIESAINDDIRRIVSRVFGADRKSPSISITESNYRYKVQEDTGTGTAYSSLLVLDLAIFSLTFLPCVSHDSVLFKNIENDSVSKLFEIYLESPKQSFIAIDEVDKYGPRTAKTLRGRSAIRLSNNSVLYMKDWRQQSPKNAF